MQHAYVFPAIRGVQAGREYFVSMCPLRIIPKIFLYDEEELGPEFRAQRTLNRGRVPEITDYILDSPSDYCFSALTASIDGDVDFEPIEGNDAVGRIHIPMDARFIINDGQHRRAAIEAALGQEPKLGSETIAVVFFHDSGLERSQQMFADLNRNAVRPSASLGVLYDHRDEVANITRQVVFESDFFRTLVELERSSLAKRSRKLFTLSALHAANLELLDGLEFDDNTTLARLVIDFWETVAAQVPEWHLVYESRMTAGEVRQDFLHPYSLALQSIGRIGNVVLKESPDTWRDALKALAKVDWSRGNRDWEGRALTAGKVINSRQNIVLTTNYLKLRLGLELGPAEREAEEGLAEGGGLHG